MLNLLRSDFYRLFKSKSYYICTLILAALIAGSAFIMDWASKQVSAAGGSTVGLSLQDGFSYGISSMFSASNNPLFMGIIIAIFITADFSHGTMKNVVSKGFARTKIYLSKLITMISAIYIMSVVVFIFGTVSAWIITGKFGSFTASYTGEILRMAGIELILYAALVAIFVMIGMTVRNTGGVIAVNIVGIISFGPMIYQLLDYLIKGKIHISDYGLQNNIMFVNNHLALATDDIIRAVCVGIGFFLVATASGILIFKNSDVK